MRNKILQQSFSMLCKWFDSFVRAIIDFLDLLCTKLNEAYTIRPGLLVYQAVLCFDYANNLFRISDFGRIWINGEGLSRWYFALSTGYTGLIIIIMIFFKPLFMARRTPKRHHRTSPAVRAGTQWVLQAFIAYLADMAKSQTKWADWRLTAAVIFLCCHVVTVTKVMGLLQDLGAADALLSMANAFSDELLSNSPFPKLLFTIAFALIVLFREHRVRVKEEEHQRHIFWGLIVLWLLRKRMLIEPPNEVSQPPSHPRRNLEIIVEPPTNVAPPPNDVTPPPSHPRKNVEIIVEPPNHVASPPSYPHRNLEIIEPLP